MEDSALDYMASADIGSASITAASITGGSAAAGPAFTGRYLSLTTYKRDGTAVATPVWFVQLDGRLLVSTDLTSGKVKRIRHNPAVRVAQCTASGRIRSRLVAGTAELLPESDVSTVMSLLKRKYRIDMMVLRPLRFLQSALHPGRPRPQSVIVAVTPAW